MQDLKEIPKFEEIAVAEWTRIETKGNLDPDQLREFLSAVSDLEAVNKLIDWKDNHGPFKITDDIYDHMVKHSNKPLHVLDGSLLIKACFYFGEVAQNGFPEKYLKKNEQYWFGDYYLPYAPHLLFAAGVASMAASKFF
jgi:hypothetical protein